MFYFFKSPGVYSYFDLLFYRINEDVRKDRPDINCDKKKYIINSHLESVGLENEDCIFYIKPNKPFFLNYVNYYLIPNDYGLSFDSGGFDLDFFSLENGFFICSERFKDFLEVFDSDVHSFWEMKVEGVDINYYLMFVGRVVVFNSDRIESYGEFLEFYDLSGHDFIDDLPVWTLKDETSGVFFSESFKKEIVSRGFLGFHFLGEIFDCSQESMPSFYNGFEMVKGL